MPHVQEAGRVREHLQTVEMLRARRVRLDLERARLLPTLLPLLLYLLREILFVHDGTDPFPHLTVNDRPALSQAHRGLTDFRLIINFRSVAAARRLRARSRATPTLRHRKEDFRRLVENTHHRILPSPEHLNPCDARFVNVRLCHRRAHFVYSSTDNL